MPTRRRDKDGKLFYELELGEGNVGGAVSPGVSELVGNAAVGELAEPRTGASSPRPLYLTECLLIGPKENAA